jgi:hypothetical protein
MEISFVIASGSPNFVTSTIGLTLDELAIIINLFLNLVKLFLGVQIFRNNPMSSAIHLSLFELANIALPFRLGQLSITVVQASSKVSDILCTVHKLFLTRALFKSECELAFV